MSTNDALDPVHQPVPVAGYRALTATEVAKMNRGKQLAELVGDWIEEREHDPTLDRHSIEIGKTWLQSGFMWAIRSIAQPLTF